MSRVRHQSVGQDCGEGEQEQQQAGGRGQLGKPGQHQGGSAAKNKVRSSDPGFHPRLYLMVSPRVFPATQE